MVVHHLPHKFLYQLGKTSSHVDFMINDKRCFNGDALKESKLLEEWTVEQRTHKSIINLSNNMYLVVVHVIDSPFANIRELFLFHVVSQDQLNTNLSDLRQDTYINCPQIRSIVATR